MEPEGSSLCKQHAIEPYAELVESSPQPHTLFFKIVLILSSHLRLVSGVVYFLQISRLKSCKLMHFSSVLWVLWYHHSI